MCNADLTPYLWFNGEGGRPAKEDFGASHKCKSFDSVLEGLRRNAVEIPLSAVKGGHV